MLSEVQTRTTQALRSPRWKPHKEWLKERDMLSDVREVKCVPSCGSASLFLVYGDGTQALLHKQAGAWRLHYHPAFMTEHLRKMWRVFTRCSPPT